MAKHTQGPWFIQESDFWPTVFIYGGESGAEHPATALGWNKEERLANARLIAAAPSMLAILERIVALKELGTSGTQDSHERVAADAERIIKEVTQ